MSNVLSHDKQQQILALGRLGWVAAAHQRGDGRPPRSGEAYLKAAGIPD